MEPTNQNKMAEEETPAHFDELMAFLDAESYDEKLEILHRMQYDLTNSFIETMAMSVDVVIPEGDIDERCRQLKNCLEAKKKYESSRVR